MAENKINLKISGMTCGGCASTVENALKGVAGVDNVRIDLENGSAAVDIADASVKSEQLVLAVKLAGYEAKLMS